MYEIPYNKDKKHGIVKGYYENGQIKSEVPYENDEIDGISRWHRENGQMWSVSIYVNNKIKDTKNYDENGKLNKE